MDITAPPSNRSFWYDRNPRTIFHQAASSTGPVTVAVIDTYTVPAGKRAILKAMFAYLKYNAAPTTNAAATLTADYSPLGAGYLTQPEIRAYLPGANNFHSKDYYPDMLLEATDIIRTTVTNFDSVATLLYSVSVIIHEYDI